MNMTTQAAQSKFINPLIKTDDRATLTAVIETLATIQAIDLTMNE